MLFTIYVDNEYTANKLQDAGRRLGVEVLWQWVHKGPGKGQGMVIACDFVKKSMSFFKN